MWLHADRHAPLFNRINFLVVRFYIEIPLEYNVSEIQISLNSKNSVDKFQMKL